MGDGVRRLVRDALRNTETLFKFNDKWNWDKVAESYSDENIRQGRYLKKGLKFLTMAIIPTSK